MVPDPGLKNNSERNEFESEKWSEYVTNSYRHSRSAKNCIYIFVLVLIMKAVLGIPEVLADLGYIALFVALAYFMYLERQDKSTWQQCREYIHRYDASTMETEADASPVP